MYHGNIKLKTVLRTVAYNLLINLCIMEICDFRVNISSTSHRTVLLLIFWKRLIVGRNSEVIEYLMEVLSPNSRIWYSIELLLKM